MAARLGRNSELRIHSALAVSMNHPRGPRALVVDVHLAVGKAPQMERPASPRRLQSFVQLTADSAVNIANQIAAEVQPQ